MTTHQLIKTISAKTGVSVADAVLRQMQHEIRTAKEPIYMRGFGTWTTKLRKEKKGQDISRKQTVIIPEHRVPWFKALWTLMLVLVVSVASGQSKIGILTVNDKTFKEYLMDCYSRPDTVHSPYENTYYFHEADQQRKDAKEAELTKMSIGKVYNIIYSPAHNDTIFDGYMGSSSNWQAIKKRAIKEHKIEVTRYRDTSYTEFAGYLIPRKPTEIDFIKWLKRTDK